MDNETLVKTLKGARDCIRLNTYGAVEHEESWQHVQSIDYVLNQIEAGKVSAETVSEVMIPKLVELGHLRAFIDILKQRNPWLTDLPEIIKVDDAIKLSQDVVELFKVLRGINDTDKP